ncbi:MAG: DMT family protein [Lentisphaeria bacterium]|nr:DMT family protein [Lentisphaeria bacterium]MBR7127277.1 DMT family protein [Lentisphaeria bacterium]
MNITIVKTVALLLCANVFMTFAWYSHLKNLSAKPLYIAILASWGIAFFEYMLQVPANRIGHEELSLAQLKIIQEVITLTVFFFYVLIYAREKISWNYLYAGICMLMAVFFMFRK